MNSKHIKDSRITLSRLMGPPDVNTLGNVHGGVIMKQCDEAGALSAMRHAQAPVVTVAVDSMTFMQPIYVGNLVMFNAELTYVGNTSMEARVEVIVETPLTGERRISNIAYLVYVALNKEGFPQSVPSLIYETDEEKQRSERAKERQEYRKYRRKQEQLNL